MIETLLALVVAYLLGSLSFAIVVSRLLGLRDPRSYGSGNPGATNVLRSGNKSAAALTLLLDAGKGWLAVWAVSRWGGHWGLSDWVQALVALLVFAGHVWPIFFRFQGGKGVATAAGVLFGFDLWLGLLVVLTWVGVVLVSKTSSLGAIVAALVAPLFYILAQGVFWVGRAEFALAIVLMSAILLYRHRTNMVRLMAGTEPRFKGSKKS